MKKNIAIVFFLFGFSKIQAQEKLTWHTDLNKAIEISNNEGKPLFLFFTGSDWCGWCIRLQNEVFKTPEFEAWAKEKVVLVELDFPRRTPQTEELKLQNNNLQQFFQVRGYPTVWLTKATNTAGKTNFEQLGSTGYLAGGPKTWLPNADAMLVNFKANTKPKTVPKKTVKTKKKS